MDDAAARCLGSQCCDLAEALSTSDVFAPTMMHHRNQPPVSGDHRPSNGGCLMDPGIRSSNPIKLKLTTDSTHLH
jgi:hypothetical protein